MSPEVSPQDRSAGLQPVPVVEAMADQAQFQPGFEAAAVPAALIASEIAEPGWLRRIAGGVANAAGKVNDLALKAHIAGSNRKHAMIESVAGHAHAGNGQALETVVHHLAPRVLSLAGIVMGVKYGFDTSHLHTISLDSVSTTQIPVEHLPADHLLVDHQPVDHPIKVTLDAKDVRDLPDHADAKVPPAVSKLAGELGYNSTNQGKLGYENGDTVWQIFANLSNKKPAETTALMQECAANAHAAGDLKVVYPEAGDSNLYYYMVKVNGQWTGNTGDVLKVLSHNSNGQIVYDGPAPSHDGAANPDAGATPASAAKLISELHLSKTHSANLVPNDREYVWTLFSKVNTHNVPADTALMEQCASAAKEKGDLHIITVGGNPSDFYYLVKVNGKWYSDTDHVALVLSQHSGGLLDLNGKVESAAFFSGADPGSVDYQLASYTVPDVDLATVLHHVTVSETTVLADSTQPYQLSPVLSLAMWVNIHGGRNPITDDLEVAA